MNFELRHLKVFVTLAEELHFGRAALRLRVAQSAVSTTLKLLEEDVGALLVARTRRSVSLTTAGTAFLVHARRALEEASAAVDVARRAASGMTGMLRIRFTLMSTHTVVPRAIARFLREYPNVTVSIEPASSVDQVEAIRAGRCDIGFVTPHQDVTPLEKETIETSPLVVVMAKTHRFAKRRRLALTDLADESFVFLTEASETAVVALFRRACNRAGFDPKIVLQVGQVDAVLAFVAAGIGIACIPAFAARTARHDVRTVALSSPPRGGISVVWNATALPPSGERFLEMLRRGSG